MAGSNQEHTRGGSGSNDKQQKLSPSGDITLSGDFSRSTLLGTDRPSIIRLLTSSNMS